MSVGMQRSKSSPELSSKSHNSHLKEVDQLNSSDIRENLTKPQENQELNVERAVKEGDKYKIQGDGKEGVIDAHRETALSRIESRKQDELGQSPNELQKQAELGQSLNESQKQAELGQSLNESQKQAELGKSLNESQKQAELGKSSLEEPKDSSEEPKTGEKEHSRLSSLKDAIAYTIISLSETVGMGVSAIVRDAVQSFGGETGGAGANGFSPADMLLLNRGMDPEHLTKGMDPEQQTSEMEQDIQERQMSQGRQESQELGNNNM
jgi:hypothetical protein